MYNSSATEAMSSALYVDNFIDSADCVSDDVQRILTHIQNIDVEFRGLLRDVYHFHELVKCLPESELNGELQKSNKQRYMHRMQQTLIKAQEMGDEKIHLVNQMQELIDNKTRHLDTVNETLDTHEDIEQLEIQQLHNIQEEDSVFTPNNACTKSALPGENMQGGIFNSSVEDSREETGIVSYEVMDSNVPATLEVNSLAVNNGLNMEVGKAIKRSRRRNDTTNDYDAFAVNEGGHNGMGVLNVNVKPSSSRSMSVSTQKKNSAHTGGNLNAVTGTTISPSGQTTNSTIVIGNNTGKKKRRKAGGRQSSNQIQLQANSREDTPPLEAIDPDEPTYCVCNQISFGEMILCDNDLCPIEWFHFSCVSLVLKPKGKWYCPNCRGDRPNIMKPKAQFLKELERYNKEKEDKL